MSIIFCHKVGDVKNVNVFFTSPIHKYAPACLPTRTAPAVLRPPDSLAQVSPVFTPAGQPRADSAFSPAFRVKSYIIKFPVSL